MTGLFRANTPAPPPPPPPPANPPSYGSAATMSPLTMANPLFTGLGNSVLTSPTGVQNDPSIVGKKTLLGQ